ncbi:hypothetical protein PRUPE_2G099700 [Prunus persica]|uniref:Disease resistance R13L4/SHOC-2-like LRR domain-containing protein n=1 Tax=Prunus persica TaxID=3760 RepID=M5XSL9_PRUPE|nr:hypothetical protein PRUPE_2G099700 [Prunus persica]
MKGDGRCLKLFLALSILFLQNVKGGEVGHSYNHSHSLRDAKVTVRCIERERQALLAFKRGLVDHFNHLSSWGKIISHKLIELQHLQYLDLTFIDFNGSQIPDFIGSLTNLRYLSLYNCNLVGQIPSSFGNLTHLQHLYLGHNQLQAENLNWLPALSSLTYLDLSGANLSTVFDWPEAVLNKLPKLVDLTLENCSLPPLPTTILSTILYKTNCSTSLENVYLSDNHVTSSIFLWLSNYSTSLVEYLDCKGSKKCTERERERERAVSLRLF